MADWGTLPPTQRTSPRHEIAARRSLPNHFQEDAVTQCAFVYMGSVSLCRPLPALGEVGAAYLEPRAFNGPPSVGALGLPRGLGRAQVRKTAPFRRLQPEHPGPGCVVAFIGALDLEVAEATEQEFHPLLESSLSRRRPFDLKNRSRDFQYDGRPCRRRAVPIEGRNLGSKARPLKLSAVVRVPSGSNRSECLARQTDSGRSLPAPPQ